jgi:hypothetical protein
MFEAFEQWMTAQFAALGRDDDAAALARRLLAWGQGLAVMAHVHNDPEFLAREAAALEAWIDSLDRREP